MRASGQISAIVIVALATSGCGLVRTGGPNDDRAERFEFVPVVPTREETRAALEEGLGPQQLVPGSVVPLGKYPLQNGTAKFFAEFSVIDPDLGGVAECRGSFGPSGGGWGCGPPGSDLGDQLAEGVHVFTGGRGFSDSWADVEFSVSEEVATLVANAADGTAYRIVPIAGMAWMEWRVERGDLVVRALDVNGEELQSIAVDANPEPPG